MTDVPPSRPGPSNTYRCSNQTAAWPGTPQLLVRAEERLFFSYDAHAGGNGGSGAETETETEN